MSKVTKDMVPEGFTVPLSIVDSIPVIFFGINSIIIGIAVNSLLFIIGAVLCFLGGFFKVLWKFIVAIKRNNIWWMFLQMRILMPIGFVLMVIACFLKENMLSLVVSGFLSVPSVVFFAIGILGMVLMGVCAFKLDNGNVKNNWIEQLINSFSQIAIFIGLIFLL